MKIVEVKREITSFVYKCDFCDEESPLKTLIEEHEAIHKLSKKPVFINGVEFYYFRTPEEMSSLSNNKIGIFSGAELVQEI